MSKRNLLIGATFVALLGALAVGQSMFSKAAAQAAGTVMAPPNANRSASSGS